MIVDYICYWIDPEDADNGTNTGFETFPHQSGDHGGYETKDRLLKWLNEKIEQSPRLETQIFRHCDMIQLEPEEVVIKYRLP